MKTLLLILLFVAGLLAVAVHVRADSPTAGLPLNVKPSPSRCTSEPADIDRLESMFAAPAPPTRLYASTKIWLGPSADWIMAVPNTRTETQSALEPIEVFFACLNAGDPLRALGTMSDSAIAASFPWRGSVLDSDAFVSPIPRDPAERVSIVSVTGVQYVIDQRICAIVSFDDPRVASTSSNVAQFVVRSTGDAWVIAEITMLTLEIWQPHQLVSDD